MQVVLSYFDPIRGPRIFCALPSELDEDKGEEIRRTLDFISRNFFAQYYGSYSIAHCFFKIKSKLGRGKSELLLLSLVLPLEERGDPTTYHESMEMLAQTLAEIDDFYLAFHEDITSEELINRRTQINFEITQTLGQFMESFPSRVLPATHKAFSVLFFGPKNSGKRTIANQIRKGLLLSAKPVTKKNILRLVQENLEIICFDSPRENEFSKLSWKRTLTYTSTLALCVDVSDIDKVKCAQSALWSILEMESAKRLPLAILANKADLLETTSHIDLTKELRLNEIQDRAIALFFVSGKKGTGLEDAFEWIADRILER